MDFRIRDKKLWTDNNNIENAKLVSSKRAKSKRGRGTRGRAGRKPQLVLSYVEKDGLGGGRWAEGGRNKKSGGTVWQKRGSLGLAVLGGSVLCKSNTHKVEQVTQ